MLVHENFTRKNVLAWKAYGELLLQPNSINACYENEDFH